MMIPTPRRKKRNFSLAFARLLSGSVSIRAPHPHTWTAVSHTLLLDLEIQEENLAMVLLIIYSETQITRKLA